MHHGSKTSMIVEYESKIPKYWRIANQEKHQNHFINFRLISTVAQALWISSSKRKRRKNWLTNRYKFVFILSLNAIQKFITCSSLSYAIKCAELHLYIRYIIESSWSLNFFCVSCFSPVSLWRLHSSSDWLIGQKLEF